MQGILLNFAGLCRTHIKYPAIQEEKIELLEEMCTAEAQLASGLGVANDDGRAQVLGRIKK